MDLKTKMFVKSLRSQIVSSLVPPSHPHTWLMYGLMFWLLQSRMSTIVMASSSPMLYYITIKEHNVFTLENIFIYLDFFNNIIISYFSPKVFFVIIYIYFLYITSFSKKNIYIQVLMYNRDKSCFLVILHCVHLQNDSDLPLIFVN